MPNAILDDPESPWPGETGRTYPRRVSSPSLDDQERAAMDYEDLQRCGSDWSTAARYHYYRTGKRIVRTANWKGRVASISRARNPREDA